MKSLIYSQVLLLLCSIISSFGQNKAHEKTKIREVVYDFSTGQLQKPNSVCFGDIVSIKVVNINSVLYDVKVETSFTDYEIPPAFTNPTNYFIIPPTDPAKISSAVKEEVQQKTPTAQANENDVKPKKEQVDEDVKALATQKKGNNLADSVAFKISGIASRYENDYEKFVEVRAAFQNNQVTKKIESYNRDFFEPLNSLIDECERKLILLEHLQDFNDLMFLLITASDSNAYKNRKEKFDNFWKRYYSRGSNNDVTNFRDALFGFKDMMSDDMPLLFLKMERLMNDKSNQDFTLFISERKLQSDENTFRQAKQNLMAIFLKKREVYSDLIRNLDRLYEKFIDTGKVFSYISTPVQAKNKDYITVKIVTKPKIQNLVFSRNMPIGDIDFLNLAEREFSFQIDVRKGLKINISTGFIANITPRDMSYTMTDIPSSDNVKVTSNVDKGFANSISYGGFLHVYSSSWRQITPAFSLGLGLNSDLSNISMLIGPSMIIGKGERFIVTAGLNINRVDRIKPKYDIRNSAGEIVIAKSLAPTEISELVNKKYMSGFGMAFTFNLNPKSRQ